MSLSGDRLAHAEHRSDLARAQLKATLTELKARLAPRRLIHDTLSDARRAGETIAENGAAAAKSHPVALVTLVAGLATIALRRKRAKRRAAHETDADHPRLKPERAKARRARKSA